MSETRPTLSIVIPALDEEGAIGATLQRCLEATPHICQRGGVQDVELIVVSDGSTDRTEEIARSFPDVTVLVFERNRGYGAAIQCGFAHASGEWVAFLDADGTCDPRFFGELCHALHSQRADVALGSRMGPESQMPWLRSVGNAIFAWILGVLAQRKVADTASGMRVLRRDRLPALAPLPDGLHFTPAMSARILLEDELRLVELPMPYAERIGRSKLSVARDGVRFLRTIVRAAMCYRPARPLLLGAAVSAAAGVLCASAPALLWLTHGRVEEWMIYRVLLASLLLSMAGLLVAAGVLADRITATLRQGRPPAPGIHPWLRGIFSRGPRGCVAAALFAVGIGVAWPGVVQFVTTGHVDMHWSRAVLAALCCALLGVLGVTGLLLDTLDLIWVQREKRAPARPPDRIHAPVSRGA